MIQMATTRLASAARCSTVGARRPSAARAAAATDPATMNSAFVTLLAATIRARSDGAAVSWMMA